jgi:hypothetical protein
MPYLKEKKKYLFLQCVDIDVSPESSRQLSEIMLTNRKNKIPRMIFKKWKYDAKENRKALARSKEAQVDNLKNYSLREKM